ncbi:MAG: UDP-N-acetylmuramoyl-L-alanyl-D-glutamate--2,6-diaminopimelate ligase [Bdellovibrionaceae bacterium]|nr:UDP-N-acetylmuramoyl-L-alanyl-D-glutamate--2,6-diaminopimelate ligase [Pseudobdellovibrionaceae bacterium]
MDLLQLFSIFPGIPAHALEGREVLGVTDQVAKVEAGCVFVALRGRRADGHQFLSEAIKRGAVALVVEDKHLVPKEYGGFVCQVSDSRSALDSLAARFYGYPSTKMFCVGVTGTNGKTSTTYMIEAILNRGGTPCAVMGTVNHHLGSHTWPTDMTTPGPVDLQKRLREFHEAGARAVAMEISSHALDQKRADSVAFDAAVFTNLTRDHLDYHGSMLSYFAAKERLFSELLARTSKSPAFAIVNTDTSWGRRISLPEGVELFTYGRADADFVWEVKSVDFSSIVFDLVSPGGRVEVSLPMAGLHNVQNATAALAVGFVAGVDIQTGARALAEFSGVPGRLQSVPNRLGISILIDYAHSPDALANVLQSLQAVRRSARLAGRIHVVFGCGGDRDRGKRPLMAQVAVRHADVIWITSDNPRTEDPEKIIADIMGGIPRGSKKQVQAIVDRREAIATALKSAQKGDVVLIAGKGHEDYQIVGTNKIPFSDFSVAQDIAGGE